jgi:hypothetical protein
MTALTPYLPVIVASLAVAVVALLALSIGMMIRLRRMERRYQALTAGTAGGSLEGVLEDHVQQVRQASGRVQELDLMVMRADRESRHHLQRLGFLRFNPFRDTGGDQSFAMALADANGNGVVLSSLHSREVTRVYAKPLAAWETSYQLTEEEQQAIRRARGEM